MKNDTKAPYSLRSAAFTLLPLAAAIALSGCGGGSSETFDTTTPTAPPQYQSESTEELWGQIAFYDFENSLTDTSGGFPNAETVGHTTNETALGNIAFDTQDGIHALSSSAIFDEISGLLLPGNLLLGPSYSVSMWVKPNLGNDGTLFFAKSEKGSLLFNSDGLTVSGPMTGHGTNGDETVTYSSSDLDIPANEWSHLVFTVEDGAPNIYLNGLKVYESGTVTKTKLTFEDGFIIEEDNFNDLFSGSYNTIAVGVSDSEEDTPFAGKIDKLRIYNYALYHGNITVLSSEAVNEGPSSTIAASYTAPDMSVNWSIDRFPSESFSVYREAFEPENEEEKGELVLISDSELPGSTTSFVDEAVPAGDSYRYAFETLNSEGRLYQSGLTSFVRVPGDEPYSAVTAILNDDEDIVLSLYSENLAVASYDVLRGFDNNVSNAQLIATGLTADTYTDEKDDNESPLADGTTYYYWVSVTDTNTSEITTSLALPEASATTAGEFIPAGTYILEEETDGFCGLDGVVENVNQGFSGTGYLNTDNAVGTAMRWRIYIESAGSYNLYVGYASGSETNRYGIMTANGEVLIDPVDLPLTGEEVNNWTTYEEVKHVVNLKAGEIALTLTSQTDQGLANVDYLKFEALESDIAPVGVECAE
ncbi:Carbohydrate binding module (family 6) [Alteromonadaceae bacterium Bs31]|nr:Carbohydrate binding module (family 6) [Alteromonadaceae bacterium Bs31]